MAKHTCPHCGVGAVDSFEPVSPMCGNCGSRWSTWSEFGRAVGVAKPRPRPAKFKPLVYKPTPVPRPVPDPVDDYISSGKFREELDDLIALAEKKAAAEAVLRVLDRLEYDVRQVAGTGGTVHSMIESVLYDARKAWEKVNEDGEST